MILVLTQCFPPVLGGIETYVAGFAEAASAAGRDVVVLADGGSDAKAYDDRTSPPYEIRRFGGAKLIRRPLKALAARRFASSCEMVLADSWKSLEWVDPKPFRAAGARIACLAHGMEFPAAFPLGRRLPGEGGSGFGELDIYEVAGRGDRHSRWIGARNAADLSAA